jgi:uncharacterized repeat protein (TIGR01451 family)
MRKKILCIISFILMLNTTIKAQFFYSQGNISATTFFTAVHDSTMCQTTGTEYYSITKTNSFMGDSIFFKDQNSGMLMAFDVNTTGTTPWIININPNGIIPVVQDNTLSAGMAMFFGPTLKIISGVDTIYNINPFYQFTVVNPCQYSTVSGKVFIDNNSDCIFNAGDEALQQIPINAQATLTSPQGVFWQNAYSQLNGNYSIDVQQSWLTSVNISIPNPNYQFIFPITNCNPTSYTYTSLPQLNANFALQCTSQIDVQAYASSPSSARPNIPFILSPIVNNIGCDSASGILTLIKDANTTYNVALSTNPASSVNGDTLKWNYVNLTNISNGGYWNSFFAGVHLTPNATVNIGDTLCFTVKSTIATNDINAANNSYSFCIPVVNSYDPNAKEVTPKGKGTNGAIPVTTTDLDYTIHFQNTGTAIAFNVSIIDTLDADILPNSLKIIGASHNMTPQWLAPNIVKFNFYNINLLDSNTNEAKSHGSVSFKVKLKPGLVLGTQIKNTGYIYFDSNPAIVTNTTLNTIANPQAIQTVDANHNFSIYPNPAQNELHIDLKDATITSNMNVTITNMNGQIIYSKNNLNQHASVNIESLNTGIYFLRIQSNDNAYQYKFIKE